MCLKLVCVCVCRHSSECVVARLVVINLLGTYAGRVEQKLIWDNCTRQHTVPVLVTRSRNDAVVRRAVR